MELRHLALARAAAAERQILQSHHHHHQHRPSPPAAVAVPAAFYPPAPIVPSGVGQAASLPVGPVPVAVQTDNGGGHALRPASQSAPLPVYRSANPANSHLRLPNATSGFKSRKNPTLDEQGGCVPVPDSKPWPTLTGSRSTSPTKRNVNSFSIDSLLGMSQASGEKSSSLAVRKSVAKRVPVDGEGGTRQATAACRQPVPSVRSAIAPAPYDILGCTMKPAASVNWF